MRQRVRGVALVGAMTMAATAATTASCAKSPVAPSGAVSVTTPAVLAPANGAQIPNLKQPVTLTVNDAFVTDSSTAVLYVFEVATDAAFVSKVQSPTAPPGEGQTSVFLNALAPGQTYYWHVRATGGGTLGTFSPASTFAVGAAVTVAAPTVVAPFSGALPSGWPTFVIADSQRSGPVAQVSYRFDVSTSSTFASTVLTATVPEANGQTSFTPSINTPVPVGTPLFWRATAIDTPDGVSSLPSATASFTPQALTQQAILASQLGQTLWPGNQPAGTNGHAILGDSCDGSGGWAIETCFSPVAGLAFQAPTIEALRFFDLFDRGYDPQSAIDWMISNGYPTAAQWYPPPDKAVLGLGFFYLAARGKVVGPGTIWDIVIGLG
jgi:hypothetical protein